MVPEGAHMPQGRGMGRRKEMGKAKWKTLILTPSFPQGTRAWEVNNVGRICFGLFGYST